MRTLCLQHVPFEGPAYIDRILEKRGMPFRQCRLHLDEALPDPDDADLLFIMGGPMGVHDHDRCPWLAREKRFIEEAVRRGAIVIGICLGAQLLADVLGAPVTRNRYREIGWYPVRRIPGAMAGPLESALPQAFTAFHWHGDTFGIPRGAVRLAESDACRNQAFLYGKRVLALQFHLEATPESVRLLFDNAQEDLDGSPYVQEERKILAVDRIGETNRLMERIVDAMLSVPGD